MIDEATHTIYVDYSTLAVLKACKRKCQLGNVIGWRHRVTDPKLSFGHAFHAGWAGYYDALAGGWHDRDGTWHNFRELAEFTAFGTVVVNSLNAAKAAFLRDLGYNDAQLPVSLESDDRRSIERGLALLEAYIYKWRAEPYENILRPDGSPLVEVGFQYPIAQFGEWRIVMVGTIDRAMRKVSNGAPVIFEGKTTTTGLSQFVLQRKPNDQITGYFPGLTSILNERITECVWDCVFISDRRPDMTKSMRERFWMYGIDIEKDFARQTTSRSALDISEFRIDLEEWALEYAKWLTSGKVRWPKTAPGACHMYGGCQFRDRCSLNIDNEEEYMSMNFEIKKWEPWRRIVQAAIINEAAR